MNEITSFKCRACNGTGGHGPIRKSTGLPFRLCIDCGGDGEIERDVDDVYDKQGHMSAVAQVGGKVDAAHLKRKKEQEASRFKNDWVTAVAAITARAR